ncbi:MAG TPA: hypothetical protein VGV61_09270 [Thermoanaerobaculia bacterium]|jgi:hypothetical protein|nr:hypothetical protein [Thermoanaerobaculia bacterium]
MRTGYNTDVRYRERVFHVQTEDKGLNNPFIESVVYFGGQVLAAKRVGYSDLLQEGKAGDAISTRMDHQHRMMIAAIRTGKLDAKLKDVLGAELSDETRFADGRSTGVTPSLLEQARSEEGPTLDQVILDYLTAEAQHEQLELALLGDTFAAGRTSRVSVRATSARSGLPVAGAQVTVKLISTVREPVLLGQGTTDDDGVLRVDVVVPSLPGGIAAVIVSATSLVGSSELKHLL